MQEDIRIYQRRADLKSKVTKLWTIIIQNSNLSRIIPLLCQNENAREFFSARLIHRPQLARSRWRGQDRSTQKQSLSFNRINNRFYGFLEARERWAKYQKAFVPSYLLAFFVITLSGTSSLEMCMCPPGGCRRVVLKLETIHTLISIASFILGQDHRYLLSSVPGLPSDLNTGNRIEGATGCPSWCRPLRPLFRSNLKANPVHYFGYGVVARRLRRRGRRRVVNATKKRGFHALPYP